MSKHFLPYSPEQPNLLPASPQDWMPSDHLAYLVRDLVSELDLSAIYRRYSYSRGAAAFDPKMMVSILLYAWANTVHSSRKMAALCIGDLGGRFLAAGHQPDFRTISAFRLKHGEALAGLFAQSVRLCQEAGMVSLGHVAVDGSKFAANASKHRVMSYGHMLQAQQSEDRLRAEIAEYLRRVQEADAQEDALFGEGNAGPALPEEMKQHKTRLARIRAAREALEEETRAAAELKREALEKERADREAARMAETGKRLPGSKPKAITAPQVEPDERACRNITDPDCRKMRTGMGEWVQGYNGQAAVDSDYQVIVACELTNQGDDTNHFQPLLAQVQRNVGFSPAEVSADAGYFSMANVEAVLACNAQPLLPPDRMGPYYQTMAHSEEPMRVAPIERMADAEHACLEGLSIANWMRVVLSTEAGAKAYARRRETVEPVFAQIKGSPGSPGFRQTLRRGLKKARQEWSWVCATHNFLKYLRFKCAQAAPSKAA